MTYKYIPTLFRGPKISKDDIKSFEASIGFVLTQDYCDFLLEYNGGMTENDCYFKFQVASSQSNWDNESGLDLLYGINHSKRLDRLDENFNTFRKRMPDGFIPIGHDAFGNRICICLSKENYGNIYFWDHEQEEGLPTYNNCFLIANSFTEFMESLKPYEEE
jgi:hypothetical protein